MIPLGLTAESSATDTAVNKKILRSGTTTLKFLNKNLFLIIMSCVKYKRYSLLIKSKGIITTKHGAIQIQYP